MTSPAQLSSTPNSLPVANKLQLQYLADARELIDQVSHLEQCIDNFFDKVDNAIQTPFPHSKAYDEMNELLALCSKLSEKAEKSQFQYLSIPTTENGSTTSSNIETYIAQGRQDIANIHKENQRFNKSFEEALRRLR